MKLIPPLFRSRAHPEVSLTDLLQKELDIDTLFEEKSSTLSEWRPRINIEEHPREYLIQADLPGINQEDIHIEIENNTLILKGQRPSENKENCLKMECTYGSFFRAIPLSYHVDPKGVTAKLKNGVLEIRLPKEVVSLSKHVPILVEE
jgi:HSP20 family protein